ncbi:MAG: VOC family protein [Anaerolineae bacterium]|nr:VOC family protein [Anaerolineae bacterium]
MKKLAEVAIFTENVAEHAAFYAQVLGGAPSYQAEDIAVFNLPGGITLLIHKKYPPVEGQPPNQDHIAFATADVDVASDELTNRGVQLLLEPKQYDWGKSAYLRDPDGRIVELSGEG